MSRDLHALTRAEGVEVVAEQLGVSVASLQEYRRGATPIGLDELYTLVTTYPDFDLVGTVARIGQHRHLRGLSRRARAAKPPKPGTLPECAGCQYPRLCEGCAVLHDALKARR